MRMLSIILFIGCVMATSFSQAIIIDISLYTKKFDGKSVNLFVFVDGIAELPDATKATAQQRADFVGFLKHLKPLVLIEDFGDCPFNDPIACAYIQTISDTRRTLDFPIGLIEYLAKHNITATNLETRQLLLATISNEAMQLDPVFNLIQQIKDELKPFTDKGKMPKGWESLAAYIDRTINKGKIGKSLATKLKEPIDIRDPYWLELYTQFQICSILANIANRANFAPFMCIVISAETAEKMRSALAKIGFVKEDYVEAPHEAAQIPFSKAPEIQVAELYFAAPLNIKAATQSIIGRTGIGQQVSSSSSSTTTQTPTPLELVPFAEQEPKRKHEDLVIQVEKFSPLSSNILQKSPTSSSEEGGIDRTPSSTPSPSKKKRVRWADEQATPSPLTIEKEFIDKDSAELTQEVSDDIVAKINAVIAAKQLDVKELGGLLNSLSWALPREVFYQYLADLLAFIATKNLPKDVALVAEHLKKAISNKTSKTKALLEAHSRLDKFYTRIDQSVLKDADLIVEDIVDAFQSIGMTALDLAAYALQKQRDLRYPKKAARMLSLLEDKFVKNKPADDPNAAAWEAMLAAFK